MLYIEHQELDSTLGKAVLFSTFHTQGQFKVLYSNKISLITTEKRHKQVHKFEVKIGLKRDKK